MIAGSSRTTSNRPASPLSGSQRQNPLVQRSHRKHLIENCDHCVTAHKSPSATTIPPGTGNSAATAHLASLSLCCTANRSNEPCRISVHFNRRISRISHSHKSGTPLNVKRMMRAGTAKLLLLTVVWLLCAGSTAARPNSSSSAQHNVVSISVINIYTHTNMPIMLDFRFRTKLIQPSGR